MVVLVCLVEVGRQEEGNASFNHITKMIGGLLSLDFMSSNESAEKGGACALIGRLLSFLLKEDGKHPASLYRKATRSSKKSKTIRATGDIDNTKRVPCRSPLVGSDH